MRDALGLLDEGMKMLYEELVYDLSRLPVSHIEQRTGRKRDDSRVGRLSDQRQKVRR